ncbi:hypothetical protein SAMN06295888_101327 [Desulfonatronum zhilinae]|nr:hypothetical protein SAMN06295888_101327 [Desulfonatronum zhilinae]
MRARCLLKTCLRLRDLQEQQAIRHTSLLDEYVRAGILERTGNLVRIKDHDALGNILDLQCAGLLRDKAEAERLLQELGLDIAITALPREALRLAKALGAKTSFPERAWHQQLSAELFGNSKFLQKHHQLLRIYSQWRANAGGGGELRIKAFEPVRHEQGLDLLQVTTCCGQAVLDAVHAAGLHHWDFSRVGLVVTCENLSPFLQLDLPRGLLVYTAGYAGASLTALLRGLPDSCRWVHFGDLDPDGLFIFENMQQATGRSGRYFPTISFLEETDLPGYPAKRTWEPERYVSEQARELARWGAERNLYVEQEAVMAGVNDRIARSLVGIAVKNAARYSQSSPHNH